MTDGDLRFENLPEGEYRVIAITQHCEGHRMFCELELDKIDNGQRTPTYCTLEYVDKMPQDLKECIQSGGTFTISYG